jgi:MFS family permease
LDVVFRLIPKGKQFNRNVRLLFGLTACIGFGYMGVHAVLLNLFLVRLGFGPEYIGKVHGTLLLLVTLFSFPAGWLGRRFGSRSMALVGTAIAVAYGLIPLSGYITISNRSVFILVSIGIFGIGTTLVLANIPPFIMGNTTPEERNRVFASYGAVLAFFAFIGSLVAGLLPGLFAAAFGFELTDPHAYGIALHGVPLVFGLGSMLMLLTKRTDAADEPKQTPRRTKAPVTIMLTFALLDLLVFGSIRCAIVFFNVYMDVRLNAPTALIGVMASLGQILAALSALLMPVLAKKLGRYRSLILVITVIIAGLLILAFVPLWLAAGLGFSLIILVIEVYKALFSVQSQEMVSQEWRAVMSGTASAARGLGSFFLVYGGGYIIVEAGYKALFTSGAALALLGLVLLTVRLRRSF